MIEVKKKIIKFVSVKPLSTNLCIFENKYFAKMSMNINEIIVDPITMYYHYMHYTVDR